MKRITAVGCRVEVDLKFHIEFEVNRKGPLLLVAADIIPDQLTFDSGVGPSAVRPQDPDVQDLRFLVHLIDFELLCVSKMLKYLSIYLFPSDLLYQEFFQR